MEIKTATGVVRPTPQAATNTTSFVYDIHIADHLGNVRVVLTEENAEEIMDMATLEVPNIPNEEEIFEGIDGSGVSTPWDWPDLNLFNQKVAELKSDGLILGPSYLQPVELGELIQVDVESFYREETDPGTPQTLLQIFGSMLVNLGLQGQGIIPAGEQGLDVFSDGSSAASQGLYSFLAGSTTELVASKPQSYLVYMFLGENLKINPAYSGIVQVGEPGTMQHLQMLERTMPHKGYFYTFVTNQSAHRVYYNNLKITRQRGTLRAMNNYYPFGLLWDNPETMPNATYQGKELQTDTWSDGSELALYDFGARMYDPVLGRWHCADPMYQFDSPYNAMANNPVVNIDPDGMWSIPWGNIMSSIGGFLSSMTATTITGYSSIPFMSKLTTTTQPNLGSGTAVSGASTLLQAWQDGKKIQDAASKLIPSTDHSGIWINYVDNSAYPSEWWGHNSLSVGPNDAAWNQDKDNTWYYSAGGDSEPRRNFSVEVPYWTPSGEWDPYIETYRTPYEHGILQDYATDDRFVFSVEIPMPEGSDVNGIVNHLVFTIQNFSKSWPNQCDGLSGTCTQRVKQLIVSSMVYNGLNEQASIDYVNSFLPGIQPPDDATWNVEHAREMGFTRYRIFDPAEGEYYWFNQGILTP